ncbi:hypothetical protein JB92DRAFT_1979935 [Gautieria morchelliformis]|nr:hypothetical protein JB92DRAFT_1979935 [Gautieria morchelliformis]
MMRPRANSTSLRALDVDDRTRAHTIESTLQAKGKMTQMNIATLPTCEPATQTPAATTTSHQHTSLHPHPSPAAQLPRAPSTRSTASQTVGTPHDRNKAQCTCGFCCSRSHSAGAHVRDFRDAAVHDAGSQDAPPHLNSTHAAKCMTHCLTAALKTEASQSIPSLPAPTSSHALASSIHRQYNPTKCRTTPLSSHSSCAERRWLILIPGVIPTPWSIHHQYCSLLQFTSSSEFRSSKEVPADVRELRSLVGDYRFFLSFSMMSRCATPILLRVYSGST